MKKLHSVMKTKIFKAVMLSVCLVVVVSCGTQKAMVNETGDNVKQNTITLLAGATYGGLVENKNMEEITGVTGVDAITGATKTRVNAGIHTAIDIKGRQVETGLDYMNFNQSVGYDLPSFTLSGDRDFSFHQLRVPLTYNFQFLKNPQNDPRLILKLGFSAGYTISKSIAEKGALTDYEFKSLDYGPTFGLAIYPYQFSQAYRTGLYLDFYRGSKIYDDIYHEAKGMGSQSYLKFGILIQPSKLRF